jgi:two-component system sporulation sensor kinase B
MNSLDVIILDFVLLTFPLLLYFIYRVYTKTLDLKKQNLYFDCALFSSCYLLFKYGTMYYHELPIFIFDIPLLISYLKNKKVSAIFLSILLTFIYCQILNIPLLFCLIQYLFYLILFLICNYLKVKRIIFINIFLIIKSITLLFYINNNYIYTILNFIILTVIFGVITNLILDIYERLDNIINCYNQVEDIEKEKRIQKSLFKITHEIKNPIAVCKGYLDMFDIENIEHSRKYIPIIKSEINRILYLLEDFLSITKIKLEKEEMDLNMLLEDTVQCLKPILDNKQITFESNITDEEIYINADYNRLKQTLVNIIKNSKEAINDEGNIKLYTDVLKNKVKIIIEDNGIGMTEEELKKIKEAFFTTKGNGTGLGTYLANEIVISHGGKLEYFSKYGSGTKVVITLPI